ncbi:MAG: hypothetical protein IH971_09950 [Candidatus Marinimicrobia bacterium]|nr:hypothetical protein [Candidatus Neomarinimicrobiota bacterium]
MYHATTQKILAFLLMVGFNTVIAQGNDPADPFFTDMSEFELTDDQHQRLSALRSREFTDATRVVRVRGIDKLFRGESIHLNLFDNVPFQALHTRTESWGTDELSWIGRPSGRADWGEYVILTVTEEGISGIIWAYGNMFGILPLGSGGHAIYRVDQSGFYSEHPPGYEDGALNQGSPSEGSPDGDSRDAAQLPKTIYVQSNHTYNILVVYTPAARIAAGGSAAINTLISNAVVQANLVYANSNSLPRIGSLYTEEVNYAETTMPADLLALQSGQIDNVFDLRTLKASDIVVMMMATGSCGLASDIEAGRTTAFAVVKQSCATVKYSFTHEIGHLFGSRHSDDPVPDPEYPYGYSFWNSSPALETVLDSKFEGRFRIPYLSNPGVQTQGVYIGTALKDNARVHDVRASAVAAFMPILSVTISGPVALTKGETGTYTANVTGGNGGIAYQWYRRFPPSTTWHTLGTNQTQNLSMAINDVIMKVVVTSGGQQAEDTQYVWYESGGGPLPKRIANLLPEAYGLHQNHPNPFNPITILRYDLPEASRVSLTIYDLAGRELRRWDTQEQLGYLQVTWDGRNEAGRAVPTGIYIYRLVATSIETSERFVANRKMVLLK